MTYPIKAIARDGAPSAPRISLHAGFQRPLLVNCAALLSPHERLVRATAQAASPGITLISARPVDANLVVYILLDAAPPPEGELSQDARLAVTFATNFGTFDLVLDLRVLGTGLPAPTPIPQPAESPAP